MIKAILSNGIIVLGLDAENIQRMLNKEPIAVNLSDIGGSDKVIIMAAPTLNEVYSDLERVLNGVHIVNTYGNDSTDKTKH